MSDSDRIEDLVETEETALEEIERGLEEISKAHGQLVAFHHGIGRAMEHFQTAQAALEDIHDDLAEAIEDDILPAGVTADGKLTYEVVTEFETGLRADVERIATTTFDEFSDRERYPLERAEGTEDNS